MSNIIDKIGRTPLIYLDGIAVKCEFMNPSGSIKDRAVLKMIQIMERDEGLSEGDEVVTCTSGNTGISLAMIGAVKGYRVKIYCPRSTSERKCELIHAYGASIILFNTIVDCKHYAEKRIEQYGNVFYLDQFNNFYNSLGQSTIAIEYFKQFGREPFVVAPDYIVAGMGTGGTLSGLYRVCRNVNRSVKLFAPYIEDKQFVEGLNDGVPMTLAPRDVSYALLTRSQIKDMQKYLAQKHGIHVGRSSAANFCVAKKLKEVYGDVEILTVFSDRGNRYD